MMVEDLVVNSRSSENGNGNKQKRIYSTSIIPPELTEEKQQDAFSTSVSGFTYSTTQKKADFEKISHFNKKPQFSLNDDKIVKEVIEHSDSSSVSLEHIEQLPEGGFPPVPMNWKIRVSERRKAQEDSQEYPLKNETENRNPLIHSTIPGHGKPDQGKFHTPKNDLNLFQDEGFLSDDIIFKFPHGEVIEVNNGTKIDNAHVCSPKDVAYSFSSGVICRHKYHNHPGEPQDVPIISKDIRYTISELVILSRSAVASMRSIALEYLSIIINRLYSNLYTKDVAHIIDKLLSESNIALCARMALDDCHQSVIQNGLNLLLLITFYTEEPIWDSLNSNVLCLSPKMLECFQRVYHGNLHNTNDEKGSFYQHADSQDIVSDSQDHQEVLSVGKITSLIKKDLIQGLVTSDVCTRLCYLLSIYKCDINVSDMILRLFIRIARHSPHTANIILDIKNLFKLITLNYLKINIDPHDSSLKIIVATNAVKFLRILATASAIKASKIAFDNNVLNITMRFLAIKSNIPNENPELLNLKKETWLLYACTLKHDLDTDSLHSYFQLLHTSASDICNLDGEAKSKVDYKQYTCAFFQTSLAIIDVTQSNDSLFHETVSLLLSILNDGFQSFDINSHLSKYSCELIRVIFTKTRPGSVSEQLKISDSIATQAINLFTKLTSSDVLTGLIGDISSGIAECDKLLDIMLKRGSIGGKLVGPKKIILKYGIGSFERERFAQKLINLGSKCEEWAARCALCALLSQHSINIPNISSIIKHWMFSDEALELVASVANIDFFITRLIYSGDWIAWLMYETGESLFRYINAYDVIKKVGGFETYVEDLKSNITPLLHKTLLMLMPRNDREDKFTYISNKLFDNMYSSLLAEKMIDIKSPPAGTRKIFSEMISGLEGNNNLSIPPCSVSWPLSMLVSFVNYGTVHNNDNTRAKPSPYNEKVKKYLLNLLNFHELIDKSYSTCRMSNLLRKTWQSIPELYIERLFLAYNVFVMPGNYYVFPEIKECLSKIMTTSSNVLLKTKMSLYSTIENNPDFFKLYAKAVINFKSSSYGDNIYAKYLLFMIRKDLPSKYLFLFLEELEEVLFLFESSKGGPISDFYQDSINTNIHNILEYENEFWFSYTETNIDLLAFWFKLIALRSLKKRSFLRAMAICYISNALFEDESSISVSKSSQDTTPSSAIQPLKDKNICSSNAHCFTQHENIEKCIILKKQIARFILGNEETCPHNVCCDEIFFWKDWPSYYYEKKQPESICVVRRCILENLLIE